MKRGLATILTIILSISLSGCWDRHEPKTLALVNSVVYDLGDSGGYKVTMEVLNPAAQDSVQGSSNMGKNPNITTTSEGPSLPEAIRDASKSLDRIIFGGHNKVRFFSEQFAKKNITVDMDFLLRDNLTDENPLMVVIKDDDPLGVYSCKIGLSETVGDYLESVSESQPNMTSKSVFINTIRFIKDYYDEGQQPVTGVVELVECDSKASNNTEFTKREEDTDKGYKIEYKGLAAFKDEKLVGYMDEVETRAYNFVTNNVNKAIITILSENNSTVVTVRKPKSEIQAKLDNGQVTLFVKIKTNLTIIQEDSSLDITKATPLKTVEAAFNKQLEEEITAAIERAQVDFKSDIFGFGKSMHRNHPEIWKEIKKNWDDYFAKATIDVSVDSTVNRSGEIKQPFRLEAD